MILQLLKDATRERHVALERQMPLLDADLQLAAYEHMVRKLFTYHKPLERSLLAASGFSDLGLDYAKRAKTARLAHDLEVLGLTADDVGQMRECEALPDLETPCHIFGCLYVLEGATLGGQIVARQLKASLGLTPESGASYFSGYGADTGPRWKAFCAVLTDYAARAREPMDIVAGANATYATLSAWMRVADVGPTSVSQAFAAAQPVLT